MSGLLSGLWAASSSAAVILLTLLLLRALFQSRTPRWVFCMLWDMVLARLLILAEIPSPVSIWRLVPALSPGQAANLSPAVTPKLTIPVDDAVIEGTATVSDAVASKIGLFSDRSVVLTAVWLMAALALGVWFFWSHLRFRGVYADSLPWGDDFVRDWLAVHSLRRPIQVRTNDRIAAPLTYGVLRPVILLPAGIDWPDMAALACVLEHEYQHIRRFDTLRKALLAAAVCLHWFNPLIWVMYILCNRDIELACDEAVTMRCPEPANYARTLLNLEERRSQWGLSGSHFSQNALEERIRTIMKHKKTSIFALVAVLVVMSVTATVFASTAPKNGENAPETGYAYDHFQAIENDLMILSQGGEDGEKQYSVDGGRTWLSEEAYHAQYGGSDWQVEWWTAGDYALWLEEEKQALQSIIGERGYTSSEGWFTWDQARVDETIALYKSILEEIKSGTLYSKTITDANGEIVEETALASGTQDEAFTSEERDALVSEGVDEAALLKELKSFGVGGSEKGGLTYRGQLVRILADGVPVGDDGYSIQYVYTNDSGTVDVHTLRSAIRNPDGSYDPFGDITTVVTAGDEGFDQSLIDSIRQAGDTQIAAADAAFDEDVEKQLDQYKPFGLTYDYNEQHLRMNWKGKSVHSLYDTQTGTWYANNMHGSDLPADAVDLETVYRDGILCGLQESQPPHDTIHAVETSAASGSSAEDGRTFEEIFAQYQSYGLVYSPRASGLGSLSWNGQAVKSFADLKPDGSTFSYQDPYAESGLHMYTQYSAEGDLTGLRAE